MTDLAYIRNVAIIAHIDHGKSTLADRLIERCGGLQKREMTSQVLDSMELERERGITIKAQTVRLAHRGAGGTEHVVNLVDTPGHVDFSYEVSRSLAACEGSLLVVDATQGVEAQTLANAYQAVDRDHEIVPVLNKMDLASAEPERVKRQIEEVIGIDASGALEVSAKTGLGIDTVLDALIARLPAPAGDENAPLTALLVDSWYDPYLGVVILVRVLHGRLTAAHEDPDDGVGRRARGRAGRRLHAQEDPGREPRARRDRLHHRRHQGGRRLRRGRHDHRGQAAGGGGAAGFSPQRAGGSSAASSRSIRVTMSGCARASPSSASTIRAFITTPRARRHWVSAFAAAFSASSISKSCRSGWSASSTSTSWRRRRAWSTA